MSTTNTMRWLIYYGQKPIRINVDDNHFKILSIKKSNVLFKTSYGAYVIKKDDVVWFRRISTIKVFYFTKEADRFKNELKKFLTLENNAKVDSFLEWIMFHCNCLGNPFKSHPNKLNILLEAEKVGLRCPDWIITDRESEINTFLKKHNKVAIKYFEHFNFFDKNIGYKNLTGLLKMEDYYRHSEKNISNFYQQYIDKKYEIRVFYLKNKFYTMGIFSQNDAKTKVDFRNYNTETPNRCIPLKISSYYIKKLKKLSENIGIDHGSFDILVDNNDNYFFLEVNPVGQFGMVSHPCNYNIEKFIAETLLKM